MSDSEPKQHTPRNLLVAGVTTALVAVTSLLARPDPPAPIQGQPELERADGYVGASACASCHPSEHASWSASYHSTMTRSPTVLFDGSSKHPLPSFPVNLELDGRRYSLRRSGTKLLYRGPDLQRWGRELAALAARDLSPQATRSAAHELLQATPEIDGEIALLTGSHHYLALWVARNDDEELRQLPFVFLFEEQSFIPRREAFLQPADAPERVPRFNANCIQCHSVAGQPQQTEGRDEATGAFWEKYQSKVVDFGIACEACHGPGQKHIETLHSPLRRHQLHVEKEQKRSDAAVGPASNELHIFVPRSKHPQTASTACGQCHSYFLPDDPETWWTSGFARSSAVGKKRLGDRHLLTRQELLQEPDMHRFAASAASLFWADGSIMVGGREYNGLLASPCYSEDDAPGKMSCSSCHSLHQGNPAGQLDPSFTGSAEAQDQMCKQCHEVSANHSGHPGDSFGARCIACHMPKTSYALLSGIRSHRIITPSPPRGQHQVAGHPEAGSPPPHPCILCHTDRSRSWVDSQMRKMWPNQAAPSNAELGPSEPAIEDADHLTSATPWALAEVIRGNAATRAVLLSALGSPEARAAAGDAPFVQVAAVLLEDDYAAIRLMARRLSKQIPAVATDTSATSSTLPIELWLQQRDTTPITISE